MAAPSGGVGPPSALSKSRSDPMSGTVIEEREVVRPSQSSHRISGFLHRHRWLQLSGLLSAPVIWLVVAYLGALAMMFITAFWTTDPFTNDVVHVWSLENFKQLVTDRAYLNVAVRSVVVASLVTLV